jgi:hypothetical protein
MGPWWTTVNKLEAAVRIPNLAFRLEPILQVLAVPPASTFVDLVGPS